MNITFERIAAFREIKKKIEKGKANLCPYENFPGLREAAVVTLTARRDKKSLLEQLEGETQ